MIGERQKAILNLIIDSYIETGQPIGSKTLANLLPYKVSSATIRNEMAKLTELGFIEQMHTSGGRVPKKSAYRFYVDNLMVATPLSDDEKESINGILSINASDPDRLLRNAAMLLAETTHTAAFSCTVKDEFDSVQGIEIIPIGKNKVMLVLLTVGGKTKSSVCKLNCPVTDEFRALFYATVKKFYVGTLLGDVNLTLIQNTVPFLGDRAFDMIPLLTGISVLCREAYESELNIVGETNLLNLGSADENTYRLLKFFADKEQLKTFVAKYAKYGKEFELFIGNENPHVELKNTTMALAKFEYNNSQSAVLGIVCPITINYKQVLPRAEYIMTTVKDYLTKEGATVAEKI